MVANINPNAIPTAKLPVTAPQIIPQSIPDIKHKCVAGLFIFFFSNNNQFI